MRVPSSVRRSRRASAQTLDRRMNDRVAPGLPTGWFGPMPLWRAGHREAVRRLEGDARVTLAHCRWDAVAVNVSSTAQEETCPNHLSTFGGQ